MASRTSSSALSLGSVGLIVVAVLCIAALVVASLAPMPLPPKRAMSALAQAQTLASTQAQNAGSTGMTAGPRLPANWVVVGCGVAAATLTYRLPRSWRGSLSLREASNRVGGRVLSTTPLASPISTVTAPNEYGGWGFHFLQHPQVSMLMADMRHQVISVQERTPYTFRWSPAHGKQPFGVLPAPPPGGYPPGTTYESVAAGDPLLWAAHTGIWVDEAPLASIDSVTRLDLQIHVDVPVGMGWQGIVLTGLGTVPVLYGRRLTALEQRATSDGQYELQLQYASGDVDHLRPPDMGCVLTLSVSDMLRVRGLPPRVETALRDSFVLLTTGVLYLVWNAVDTWAPQLGFVEGLVATATPLGRMVLVQPNVLRCTVTRKADVAFWTDMIVNKGDTAARTAAADQLSAVFGSRVPLPASISFQGWPHNLALWQAAVTDVAAARAAMMSDLATAYCVPVLWANADISDYPGTLEGAVADATRVANEIQAGTARSA